jgi:predicted Fe-Mo cluster-binding NifX family protein
MRLCIPIKANDGKNSKVNAHFGSAPYFLIYNTEGQDFEIIGNSDSHHIHGMCHPLKALENQNIDAVVCGGMGARAVQKLNEGGIKAYRANAETVQEIIENYQQDKLEELTINNACIDHNCH